MPIKEHVKAPVTQSGHSVKAKVTDLCPGARGERLRGRGVAIWSPRLCRGHCFLSPPLWPLTSRTQREKGKKKKRKKKKARHDESGALMC